MKYSTIGYILGQVLKFEGIFMLLPFLTGMIYHENEAYSYLIIGIICFVLGCLITLKKVKHPQIFNREGFVAVALSWIVLSIFGAIPFVITGEIPSYVDALFETISGFTTTGSSILTDVESISKASLFWRSFSHWIGGMGVLVFILAVWLSEKQRLRQIIPVLLFALKDPENIIRALCGENVGRLDRMRTVRELMDELVTEWRQNA